MSGGWSSASPIYAIDVSTFRDADGDGIGDLAGVAESLDYVKRLGAGCIWLLPFFTSPGRDNGYDVVDYYGIDSRFGSFGDFVDLMAETKRHGLRVVIDLVVNHTSDQHPWFKAARARPTSPLRDYYSWTDHPPPLDEQQRPTFPDKVPSVWTWDEAVGAFYYHQFYPFQPSLNHTNPAVNDEIRRIIGFWLQLGVDGFRLDAAGHLGEPKVDPGSDVAIDIVRRYRSYVTDRSSEAALLGEADLPADRLRRMLGPDRLQMLFDFIGNAHLYLAFARESAEPLVRAHDLSGDAPEGTAWVRFLRNLDEVDLERLTEEDGASVIERFAPDRDMRIFHRGIRRRLAPMLDGDERRVRLAFSLMLSMPGVPMIVYGDEIGMGDDLSLAERGAVRTAMQWAPGPSGGFSEAAPEELRVPTIRDGPFGADEVNVTIQERDPASLLNFVRAALRTWRELHPLRVDRVEMESIADDRVLATCVPRAEGSLVMLHNLSSRRARFEQPWRGGTARTLLGSVHESDDGRLTLEPFGFCWMTMDRS